MPYSVVNSEIKYKGRIVDVKLDEITLPDGNTAFREVVLRGRAAAVIPVDDAGNIILVRQYRHGAGRMVLEIPAGMTDEGEETADCAVRELQEETGFIAGKIEKLVDFHVSVGYCTEVITIYLATQLKEGRQNLDHDEFIELERFSLKELVKMVMEGRITDSKTIIGIMMVNQLLEERQKL